MNLSHHVLITKLLEEHRSSSYVAPWNLGEMKTCLTPSDALCLKNKTINVTNQLVQTRQY